MPDRTPKYSLQTISFNPGTFKGAIFEPQQEDLNLLAHSLSKMEERERTANEKISAMDVTFGQLRSKLHQDAESLNWFDKFSKKYKDQVNSYAQVGDYGNAINEAVRLAGESANDAELIGRIRTSEQYAEQEKRQYERIAKGSISQETFNWWKKNNPYKYTAVKDEAGNITGAEDILTNVPYDDINFADLALAAYKMIQPDKSSVSSSSESSRGSNNDGNGFSRSSGSSRSTSHETIRMKDILDRMPELIATMPGGFAQVEQAFAVHRSAIEDMENEIKELNNRLLNLDPGSEEYNRLSADIKNRQQQLDKRNELTSKNGSPITDYKEFFARRVMNELFAQGLAHNWTTSSTTTSSDVKDFSNSGAGKPGGKPGGNGTGGYNTNDVNSNSGTVSGPNVQQTVDTSKYKNYVEKAAENITYNFMGGKKK